jgi:uncharacterized RDD family membrane protein YckC
MNWYYANQGQQAGPIDDAQLEQLRASGIVRPDTLVWREGMENWAPYSEAKGGGAPAGVATAAGASGSTAAATASATEAVCAECNAVFSVNDMIRHGGVHVCANCKPVFMQKIAEGAQIPTGELQYAGFWIRFAAKFVDGLLVGLVFLAPLFYIGFRSALDGEPERYEALQWILQIGYYVAALAYNVFFIGKYAATPGKMLCKLKVVTGEGGKVTYARATGRYFAEILSGLICNIGYIIAAFDDQKRALHDRICNTRVIYK